MLEQRTSENPDYPPFHTWKMNVVLATDYYPLTLIFDNGLEFRKGDLQEPDIRIGFQFNTLLELVQGKKTLLGAILGKAVKIEGLLQHPTDVYRLYKLIRYIIEE